MFFNGLTKNGNCWYLILDCQIGVYIWHCVEIQPDMINSHPYIFLFVFLDSFEQFCLGVIDM